MDSTDALEAKLKDLLVNEKKKSALPRNFLETVSTISDKIINEIAEKELSDPHEMEVFAHAVQKLKESDSGFHSPHITGTGGVVGETMEKAEKIRTFEEIMGIENDSPTFFLGEKTVQANMDLDKQNADWWAAKSRAKLSVSD